MSALVWMKELPWVVAFRESSWVYPSVETVHGIGMGLLVGTLTVIDIRVLGGLRRLPLELLPKLSPFLWVGFVLNACSGVLMFMSDGPRLIDNWIFQAKMILIGLGLVIAWRLQRELAPASPHARVPAGPPRVRGPAGTSQRMQLIAALSLLIWYAAIVAGRVTAFLGDQ
ncbi:MAG TPA: hypothetical protein VMT66_09975 [Steroidobacteraceae bacterium]|nr:hypothetical protein [Steroidobacteraceae bacterium]